jgi:hypothetical protein
MRKGLALVVLGALWLPAEGRPTDPLAKEIARWTKRLASAPAGDELWGQIKAGVGPEVAAAEKALADGRRLFAFERIARALTSLGGADYAGSRPEAQRSDPAAFEAAWAREKRALDRQLGAAPATVAALRPAAVRAVAEMALAQARIYLGSSLEYARATDPGSGLFYLGAARAQLDVIRLARAVAAPARGREPALRPLDAELAALEGELVGAYRPPASIDKHADFIRASSVIKEARELDALGLRRGALLRYLQAADRVERLVPSASLAAGGGARLDEGGVDHSIGRLLIEAGQENLVPRYLAALEPRAPVAVAAPEVTVTVVRWPFT